VRAAYERFSRLDEVLDRVRALPVRTVIFDVEPLIAHWDSGQAALDRGVELVLSRVRELPELELICFATNSLRRPSTLPKDAERQVVYVASAGKPLRTGSYQGFPRPGVVIGDQVATDGILAWRLGYTFAQYRPPLDGVPVGPRLMNRFGQLVRPLLFRRPG
jgi:hypothetical protein